MSRRVFMENSDGVHLMCPINSEFSLCGDAWDGSLKGDEVHFSPMKGARRGTVTCARCTRVILECRGVRVAALQGGEDES